MGNHIYVSENSNKIRWQIAAAKHRIKELSLEKNSGRERARLARMIESKERLLQQVEQLAVRES